MAALAFRSLSICRVCVPATTARATKPASMTNVAAGAARRAQRRTRRCNGSSHAVTGWPAVQRSMSSARARLD